MDVAITGSSGLIGTALASALEQGGHRVVRLVRPGTPLDSDSLRWDPVAGTVDAGGLEGIGAVVHLAGKGVGEHRWTKRHKAEVLQSRVVGTRLLVETLAALQRPPSALVSASGIDYYGDRGDEVLTEDSGLGSGFLADVCARWEAATAAAAQAGIRVARIRSGIVLSPKGGALARMLTPFKLGLGGKLGSGEQWWSWISIEDEAAAIVHLIQTPGLSGPFNLTAPHPVTNARFTCVLGKVLGRPTVLSVPKLALRAAFGEFADEALLGSHRIVPHRLEEAGYQFRSPQLEEALRDLLGASSK